ncbi:MAG TPA: dTMP kinase [Polyangiales bacterium]
MSTPSPRPGPFIVIEGIDGAGTTTQTERLVAALRAERVPARATREPTDGPVGMLLRQVLRGRVVAPGGGTPSWQELGLLFAADRLDHAAAELTPRRAAGDWLVSDRYDFSSVAYQSASAADARVIPWLRELNRFAPRPDLTLVIDVSPEVARARRTARAGTREIFDDDPFQAHLAAFYRDIDRHFPEDRIVHVDGDGDPDQVFAALWPFVVGLKQ